MKKKKILREKDHLKGVFIEEDLTAQRAKLYHAIRKANGTKKIWTIDGRIHCLVERNGREEKHVVETSEDLFHLGWTEEQLKNFAVGDLRKVGWSSEKIQDLMK